MFTRQYECIEVGPTTEDYVKNEFYTFPFAEGTTPPERYDISQGVNAGTVLILVP